MNRWLLLLLCAGVAVVAGCEDTDDDTLGGRNYQPPPGLGAIVIENDSAATWNVAIDGVQLGRVATGSFLVRDAAPGPHWVHLDEHEGRDIKDVTVEAAEGMLAVVRVDGDVSDYDVGTVIIDP